MCKARTPRPGRRKDDADVAGLEASAPSPHAASPRDTALRCSETRAATYTSRDPARSSLSLSRWLWVLQTPVRLLCPGPSISDPPCGLHPVPPQPSRPIPGAPRLSPNVSSEISPPVWGGHSQGPRQPGPRRLQLVRTCPASLGNLEQAIPMQASVSPSAKWVSSALLFPV